MGQQRRRHTAEFKAQVAVAALKEQQTLNETLDEFTGLTRGSVFDLDGNLINSAQNTIQGTRLRVEPFA
jgi:hypothetical protein